MSRSSRLLQAAAEAELLRLKQLGKRSARRVVWGSLALFFLIATLVACHIALALTVLPRVGALYATLIVLAGDVALLIVFAVLAATKGPGKIEVEAYQVRESARMQLMGTVHTVSTVSSAAQLLGNRSKSRLALAGLLANDLIRQPRR